MWRSGIIIVILLVFLHPVSMQDDYDVCSSQRPGGALCSCKSGTSTFTVDCTNKKLTEIPKEVSGSTTTLVLSSNEIQHLNTTDVRPLKQLEKLYLDNNDLSYIAPRPFQSLFNLKYIYLSHNKISRIGQGVFAHLPSLVEIDLSNNEIVFIHRHAFLTLPSLTRIDVRNNEITCGCNERELKKWIQLEGGSSVGQVSVLGLVCENFNGVPLIDVPDADLPECQGSKLFESNPTCFGCGDAKSTRDCGSRGTELTCSGSTPMCYNIVLMESGRYSVHGGCMDYSNCIGHEKGNIQTCKESNSVMCHYCCTGSECNKKDLGNKEKTFDVKVTIELGSRFPTDTSAGAYQSFQINSPIDIENLWHRSDGSFQVSLQSISTSKRTAVYVVNASTVWFISKSDVMNAMRSALDSNGFLNGYQIVSYDIELYKIEKCPAETTIDSKGEFNWPETEEGVVANVLCPALLTSNNVYASRNCKLDDDGNAYWLKPRTDACPYASELSRQLLGLSDIPLTEDSVTPVTTNLSVLSSQWPQYESQDLDLTMDIVEDVLETTGIDDALSNALTTMDNLLNVDTAVLADGEQDYRTSTRIVAAVDTLTEVVEIAGGPFAEVRDNIAGFANKIDADTFEGLSMFAQTQSNRPLADGEVEVSYENIPGNESGVSGITVYKTVLDSLTPQQRRSIGRLTFALYRSAKIFESVEEAFPVSGDPNNTNESRSINSHVIAATVPGVTIQDLQEPVEIIFSHLDKASANPACVYWDISSGNGQWSHDGCSLNHTDGNRTICRCNHMTNFALLMDVYGSSGKLDEVNKKILSYISYIGCGISLFCLILTLLTYAVFTKLRRDNPSKILINLCTVLALADFVFLVGMQGYTLNSNTGCKIVAALLHFCLLSAMCWMAVEAFYMYLALVKVFNTYISKFLLKSSLFGYGIPLAVVIVTLAVNKTDNYGIQRGDVCWMSPIPFYTAFLTPVCIILILNFIAFILVLRQLLRRSSQKLTKTKTDKVNAASRLRAAVSIVVLLGLTWLFGIFAVDGFGIVFTYLFAIFNSLQGLFIFIFYCFLKKDAQNAWKRKLPCCRSPYEANSSTSNKFNTKDFDKTFKTTVSASIDAERKVKKGSKGDVYDVKRTSASNA